MLATQERASRWLLQQCARQRPPLSSLALRLLQALVEQTEQTLVPVSHAMQYIEGLDALLRALRTALAPSHAGGEILQLVRRLWLALRCARLALQRDFFANYEHSP